MVRSSRLIALAAVAAALALAATCTTPVLAHMGPAGHSHPHGGGLFIAPGTTILLNERIVDVTAGCVTDTRIHEKVLLETADSVANFTEVQFTYNSIAAKVSVPFVRRFRPDGKGHFIVTELPTGGSTTRDARYEDAEIDTLRVKFPDCQPGDIVEFEFLKHEAPLMFGKFYTTLFWQAEYKTAASRLILTVPTNMAVASKCWGATVTPQVAQLKERTRYTWALDTPLPAWDPKAQPIQPCVVAGTPTTWQEVGDWYRTLFGNLTDATPTVRAKARDIAGRAQYTDEKVKLLSRYVCTDLRSDAYEVGAAAWRPVPGDQVLAAGGGDCKGKAALLCAMLRSVGVTAQLAMTYTSIACPPLADQLPSPFAFNHVLVAVSGPGNAIWIDPTTAAAKVYYWGNKREAMLLSDTSKFLAIANFANY